MRIVVLGDFHIDGQHPELTIKAMEDVAMIAPDLVIPLGDFGRNGRIGRPEGLREAKDYLDRIGAPLRPIMGNHDLERESGGVQPSGMMEKAFLDIFGLQEPYGVLEFPEWRLFFASTEPQPADSCYDVQECYATDRQFDALVAKLKERPGVPVIFFTHAPPIGSGLRTVPRVHVRSTNAYLDQNHDPYRWLELVRSFPEIVMWFSAHYHLSQGYANSHTILQETHFFLTGVHSSCTRDGKRQSRVLDIDSSGIGVRTLDHIERRITEEGAFVWSSSPGELIGYNVETAYLLPGSKKLFTGPYIGQSGAKQIAAGKVPSVRMAGAAGVSPATAKEELILVSESFVGETAALPCGLVPLRRERYLVATEDGFSWEAEPKTRAVLGTLHIGPPLSGIAATDNTAWISWDNQLGCSFLSDPWRFVRLEDGLWPQAVHSFDHSIEALAAASGDTVLAAAGGGLWEATANVSGIRVSALTRLPDEPCRHLVADGDQVWAVGRSGKLYVLRNLDAGFTAVKERVAAWDAWEGESAALIAEQDHYAVEINGPESRSYLIPLTPCPTDAARLVCLGQGAFALMVQGKVFAGSCGLSSPLLLPQGDGTLMSAICRSAEDARQLAVSGARSGEGAGTLQIWEFQAR